MCLRILLNALSIGIAVKLIDGLTFTGEWWKMIIVGAIFGLVNALIKPFITLFTLPFIIITLGLFTIIINALMLDLTAYLSEFLNLGFRINGFWPAIKGALLISIISIAVNCIFGSGRSYHKKRSTGTY